MYEFEAMQAMLGLTYTALSREEDIVLPEEPDGWTHQERLNEDQKEEDSWSVD